MQRIGRPVPRFRAVLVAFALAASLVACALSSCTQGNDLTAGQHLPGLGDSYYPELGNPGYSSEHYALDLTIDPLHGSLSGIASITAHATADLDRMTFDLVGLEVQSVTVGGKAATSSRAGDKLVVVPSAKIPSGTHFSVSVTYRGTPKPIDVPSGSRTGATQVGWHHDGDEIYVASEVAGARSWYPVNDTPRDKASYTFALTVPSGYTAVANGMPAGETPHGSATTFVWEESAPMASYLATVVVGHFTKIARTGPHGLPILVYAPPGLAARAEKVFAQLPDMVSYFESILGTYPFDSAGAVVVTPDFRWSLETQTRPVYGSEVLNGNTDTAIEGISHELSHQWFGDSVTPSSWSDIWLNEGFATYMSWLWLEHAGDKHSLAAS